ncbi:MAG: PDZ domain-containing protein, partial [Cytophagales bacterium]|nr:PDZ domain-containing protein [Cytophagales bacterium]
PMGNFFKNHIYGTTPPEYALYLGYVGLKLTNTNEGRNDTWLGVSLNTSGGKAIVTAVTRNSAAWNQGIYVNDEIVAINNFRVTGEISNFLFDKKPGDTLQILVSRDGILRTLEITLSKSELVNYRISKTATATEFQKSLYKKWMKADY